MSKFPPIKILRYTVVPLVFPPSMEAAGVNRPQQFVVLIKQLTFLENLTCYIDQLAVQDSFEYPLGPLLCINKQTQKASRCFV